MKLPLKRLFERAPDVIIGGEEDPYMRRWHLIPRNRFCNVYLHHFLRSDDDRALHDHPWWSVGVIVKGSYIEMLPHPSLPEGVHLMRHRRRFRPVFRRATQSHRVQLIGHYSGHPQPVWTVFVTGRRVREWGFHCPKGWRHWSEFTDVTGRKIGKGCE